MMKKTIAYILSVLALPAFADLPAGTMLADDLTSTNYVVVDAFLNSSNRVHDLIESVSPRTSLEPATNYTDDVASYIAQDATNYTDRSSAIALQAANDYTTNKVLSLKSELEREISSVPVMTTNDVQNIVTNEIAYSFGQWRFFIGSEEQSSNSFSIEEQYAQEEYAYFLYYMGEYISVKSFATEQETIYWTGLGFGNLYSTRTAKTKNALGLARLNDIPTNNNQLVNGAEYISYGTGESLSIGSRRSATYGANTFTQGRNNIASGSYSMATGDGSTSYGWASEAHGIGAMSSNSYAYTWNGIAGSSYGSHLAGSFSVNPQNGGFGFYIGDRNLYELFSEWIANSAVSQTVESVEISEDLSETNLVSKTYAPLGLVTHQDLENALEDVDLTDYAKKTELTPLATKESLSDLAEIVNTVSNESAVVTRLYTSSNVIDEVTNYNSVVHIPSRRMYQLTESNEYVMVWNEMNQHTNTLGKAQRHTDDATNALAKTMAPRAWSKTTSGLGADAPANTTWISTPTTVIAGGLEYSKVIHSYGQAWVLSGNGMIEFNPNTNAYLRIAAEDGTEIFSIEKTDAVTVGADADGITVEDNVVTIPVGVVSGDHPTMYWRQTLDSGTWKAETDSGLPFSAVWSGGSGAWVMTVTFSSDAPSSSFFRFTYEVPGSTVIKNSAATDVSGGLVINGVPYRNVGTATINGHTVITVGN